MCFNRDGIYAKLKYKSFNNVPYLMLFGIIIKIIRCGTMKRTFQVLYINLVVNI